MIKSRNRVLELMGSYVSNVDAILEETPTARAGLCTGKPAIFSKSLERNEVLEHNAVQALNELISIYRDETGDHEGAEITKWVNDDPELKILWERCKNGSQMAHDEVSELRVLTIEIDEFNQPVFEQAQMYDSTLKPSKPKVYGKRRI